MLVKKGFSGGGAFKAPAASNEYNHNHASNMAHAAASRRAIAHALGSVHGFGQGGRMQQPVMGVPAIGAIPPGLGAPPAPPVAMGAPPGPAAPPPAPTGLPGQGAMPGVGALPGGMPTRPPSMGVAAGHTAMPTQPPPAGGNFKADIAHRMASGAGLAVSHNDVKNAIATATQKGAFTPQQGAALIAHTGPLQGPGAAPTRVKIMMALVGQHRGGGLEGMGMAPGAHTNGPPGASSAGGGLFETGANT